MTNVTEECPYWTAPRDWVGDTVAILGNGPSLNHAPLELLRNRPGVRVIATKEAWWKAPWADAMVYCDDAWTANMMAASLPPPICRGRPPAFKGDVITVAGNAPPGVRRMRYDLNRNGLAETPDTLRGSRTVLQFAMGLAVHRGARRILLIAFEMARSDDGATHWYAGHSIGPYNFSKMLNAMETMVEPLRFKGVEVINCTPGGALELFPRRSLTEVLQS